MLFCVESSNILLYDEKGKIVVKSDGIRCFILLIC